MKVHSTRQALAGLLVTALFTTVAAQTTELVTHGVDGQANAGSLYPEISADGVFITFQSGASNLVEDDTNEGPDCFLYNRTTDETTRISVSSSGAQAIDGGLEPVISLDNRYITYYSFANELVPGDKNGAADIFLYHIPSEVTSRVTQTPEGGDPNGGSRYPVLDYFGEHIAYESSATNLVAGDLNGARDVFVLDRGTGVTMRVSTSASGVEGNGDSTDAFISPDGRYVAFESLADNLVVGDSNGVCDVFVKDIQTGAIYLASVSSTGEQGNDGSQNGSISDQGLRVAFSSNASNLVAADANGYEDLFVYDVTTGLTERVNVSTEDVQGHIGAYEVILSPDGGFAVFFSAASNHVLGDTNSQLDIFVRDIDAGTTERVSVGSLGEQGFGECLYPAISDGGRFITFDSASDNLILGDENMERDIFVIDRYSPFRPFCSGDGSLLTACPCGNSGVEGRGCDNSSATGGATLVATGQTDNDTVQFDSTGLPTSTVTVLLQAQNDSSSPGIAFGDGLLCSTGSIKRLYVKVGSAGNVTAPGSGDLSVKDRSAAVGDPLTAGDTRYYQFYYRDANPSFCTSGTFNTSNGIEVQW